MKNSKRKPRKTSGGSFRLLPLLVIAGAVSVGLILGRLSTDSPEKTPPSATQPSPVALAQARGAAPTPAAADGQTIARVKLDLDGAPVVGPETAPITIVEFVDYQCPFCRRSHGTVDQVREKYGDDVRVVFLQNPLSFHKEAPLASQAALAANEQGRFAEMHDILLSNTNLKRPDLERYAQQVGLDMTAFKEALDSGRFATRTQNDQAQAQRVGASATPFFFVNGRSLRGAQPFPAFQALIDQELKGDLPPTRWVARVEGPPRRQAEDPNKVYKVDLSDSIARGPENAPITLVEFTAFQCGFCARSQSTVNQILSTYTNQVRLLVKYMPLRDHQAAIASLAADRQGKYWEYRKLLFDNQRALNTPGFIAFASELGLDMNQFETDLKDPALAQRVQKNVQQAAAVGVRGTPTFFVNGKKIVGAQPFASFKAIIDQQLAGGAAGQGAMP